ARVGGLEAQDEVQEDERIWIPRLQMARVPDLRQDEVEVQPDPDHEDRALDDDERPAPHDQRDAVGDALAERQLLLVLCDDVPDGRVVVLVIRTRAEPEGALRHGVSPFPVRAGPRRGLPSHSASAATGQAFATVSPTLYGTLGPWLCTPGAARHASSGPSSSPSSSPRARASGPPRSRRAVCSTTRS